MKRELSERPRFGSIGLDKDACVVGLGGYLAKDEFKKEGGSAMKAASYFSSDAVGTTSVKILLDIIAGKEVPMETAVDAIMVTPRITLKLWAMPQNNN